MCMHEGKKRSSSATDISLWKGTQVYLEQITLQKYTEAELLLWIYESFLYNFGGSHMISAWLVTSPSINHILIEQYKLEETKIFRSNLL